MLYRSTMKIATATILGLIALFGVSAHAIVYLDRSGSAVGTVVFSKETIPNAEAGTTLFPVTATDDTLEIRGELGFQVVGHGAGETAVTVAVRYDLINMEFDTTPDADDIALYAPADPPDTTVPTDIGDGEIVTASVRTSGKTFIEYRLTLEQDETIPDGSELRLTLTDHLAVSATEPGRIRLRVDPGQQSSFEDLNPRDVTVTAVQIANSISVTTKPASVTAEVTENFEAFVGGASTGLLGELNFIVNPDHFNAQDGSELSFANTVALLNDSSTNGALTITFRNGEDDFEFADFRLVHVSADGMTPATSATCAMTGSSSTDLNFTPTGQTELNFEMGTVVNPSIGNSALCIDIKAPEEGEDRFVLPETEFEIDAAFVKSSDRQFAPTSVEGVVIGTLRRNGTTVQIPFLSQHERHNQRLIIVNRGRREAEYRMAFTSAAGVEVTALADATGTVPGGQELILRVADIINIQDANQTAATLTLVAAPSTIDVSTSTLTDNGSSDTVNYNVR